MPGKNLQLVKVLAGLSFLVVSCGGSGGGGGTSGIKYDGNTEAVVITEDNADEVALSSYESSSGSESSGVGMVNQFLLRTASENPQPKNNASIASGLVNVAWSSISNLNNQENRSAARTAAKRQTFSESETGSCGGSMTVSGWGDDSNFTISATLSFSNFCESGEVVNGTMNVLGQFDDDMFETGKVALTFSKITFEDTESSVTVSGKVNASVSLTSMSLLINMTARDNIEQKTYKFVNFDISNTTSDEYYFCDLTYDCIVEMSFSGTIYDYDYGVSEIATEAPFVFNGNTQYPSSGSLIVTGGAANELAEGATKAKLTILDINSYQVEADTTGDGFYDYSSEPIAW